MATFSEHAACGGSGHAKNFKTHLQVGATIAQLKVKSIMLNYLIRVGNRENSTNTCDQDSSNVRRRNDSCYICVMLQCFRRLHLGLSCQKRSFLNPRP